MVDYMGNLKKELRKKMDDKNWSRLRLAMECEVSIRTIDKILYNGGGICTDTLLLICENAGISLLNVFEMTTQISEDVIRAVLESLVLTDGKKKYSIEEMRGRTA